MNRSRLTNRLGFSLLEILVATAMLAVALAAVSQLASIGKRHLQASAHHAVATRLAANKMARLTTGLDPLDDQDAEPMAEDPAWQCQIQTLPVGTPGLVEVRVSVRPTRPSARAIGKSEEPWFTLARWVADPSEGKR